MLTEIKVRFVASCDVVLSRICLPEELWEFTVRDTFAGFQGSLTDLVGGASSLFSRPDGSGTEPAASRQSSYDGPLASLNGIEREKAVRDWRRNGEKKNGGKPTERIEGVTSWDEMDGVDGKRRKSVLFSGFTSSADGDAGEEGLTKKLLSDEDRVVERASSLGTENDSGKIKNKVSIGSKKPSPKRGMRRRSLFDYGGGARRRLSSYDEDNKEGKRKTARSKSSVN